ncbi:MAG: thiamine pyrophosphate-binding protein, partial [Bryobacteraceae bacterium]
MTAVEWLIQHLSKLGLPFMATLCGHGLDPLFQAARRAGLRLVDTRNEQTASYLCEAYGKLTRLPGVCAVSSGVAHVNALAGVANAWFDGAPMLLISGAGPLRTAGMGHFQDMDQVSLAHPITRFARVIDQPDRVLFDFEDALHAAVGPPPGPAHLTFPMDVQTAEVLEADLLKRSPDQTEPPAASGDQTEIARSLQEASRPVIVAGSGIYYQTAEQDLLDFSREFAIPIVTPIWDRGCVTGGCETFLGVAGAASGG